MFGVRISPAARALPGRLAAVNVAHEAADALREVAPDLARMPPAAARQILPQHGRLDERVAASRITATVSESGRSARLRIEARSDMEIDSIDKGTVHHLTFGRGPVTAQAVRPGWFTLTLRRDGAPKVRSALLTVGGRIARRLQ